MHEQIFHWESFYNQDDFYNIKNSGINTVRLKWILVLC